MVATLGARDMTRRGRPGCAPRLPPGRPPPRADLQDKVIQQVFAASDAQPKKPELAAAAGRLSLPAAAYCPPAPLRRALRGRKALSRAPASGPGERLAYAVGFDRGGQAVAPASWPASLICSMAGALAAASLRSWRRLAKPNSPPRKDRVPRPKATREMM